MPEKKTRTSRARTRRPAARPRKAGKASARKRRPASPPPPAWRAPRSGEVLVGVLDDYLSHLGVATMDLRAPLAKGDRLYVRGHTTDFLMTLQSLQVDHVVVESARKGAGVGIRVTEKCREGDHVFRIA